MSAEDLADRTIVCHLGSGASITALKNGESVETSMGYSPVEGTPMSSRSGDVGVGAVLEILKEMPREELIEQIYKNSGLLALSGYSSDMEVLVNDYEKNRDAAFAVDTFVYQVACQIGSQATALGGIDLLVFSGGIGENSKEIRSWIVKRLAFLGIQIDEDLNLSVANLSRISGEESSAKVLVVSPEEEKEIISILKASV
ncbi:MAG: hypothetical protein U5L75_00550 [Candidatus Campbellbacteria bacterium]|nr:hypothetical protein [Candidatus Campbellbacteria bacterium]